MNSKSVNVEHQSDGAAADVTVAAAFCVCVKLSPHTHRCVAILYKNKMTKTCHFRHLNILRIYMYGVYTLYIIYILGQVKL